MELSVLYQWVNFFIFVGLLFYFLRESLHDFLGDRRETLKKEIDEIAGERLKSEKRFQEYRKKMAGLGEEVDQLNRDLKQKGEMEKVALIKKAQSFAAKIREDIAKVGEQELVKTKLALKKKILMFAVELAKTNLEKAVDGKDQERLFTVGINHLEKAEYV